MKGNWKWPGTVKRKEETQWLYILKAMGVTLLLSYFFYRSVWAVLPVSVLGYGYFCWEKRRRYRGQKDELLMQFGDLLQAVAVNTRAGYSVENALMHAHRDMVLMHGERAEICRELTILCRGLEMHQTLESLLQEFGIRSGLSQVREFASVFVIAKRSGGNVEEVIQHTVEGISRQMSVQEEMITQLSGKRMECNIMRIMPFLILWYIDAGNKGYFDMLYHNPTGILLMSGCLVVYLAAYALGEKIIEQVTV